ncbi:MULTISPECIES: hypothetical protein [Chryseobacterium]|uniref:Uncharacterized protein n=1 Tax=Chryseobacterium taihuense TaxID=1141221 RepID=A0A4U8WDT7_9FLAO|nr:MULTISPECIES: hypothetical protein [Chryseobacterium]QQV02168.1 hypothetical protein I6I61_13980 [Chryseobacterium sp. FDAARGOS 1104]VFB04597.1 Uncharacterised protein [Chryseobacterium taihuense]
MKKLFYFVILIAGLSSIHSCKDLVNEEGDPLLDLNDNTGLIGPRALSREVTDVGTIAEYQYSGLLLTKVLTEKGSVTNIEWSGDKISKITYYGFLDSDGDGVLDTDSTAYTQQFTYGNLGRLTLISENRTTYTKAPGTPPQPWVVLAKRKALYNLTYSSTTGKLASIDMRDGADAGGSSFVYTDYSKATFTYLGDNVSSVLKEIGVLNGNIPNPPTQKYGFEFTNYDAKINAYTLLPFEYKVSHLISTEINDDRSMILSPNNPKRVSITDLMVPIPSPVMISTDYKYDPQMYVTQGFLVNYFYKPL